MTSITDVSVHATLPAGLAKGYASFRSGRLGQERERFRTLAEKGQKPPALLIGCCDSRVAPEAIFDAGPGGPWVREREAAGELSLHGAQFGIADGGMLILDQARGEFVPAMQTS